MRKEEDKKRFYWSVIPKFKEVVFKERVSIENNVRDTGKELKVTYANFDVILSAKLGTTVT